MVHTKLLNSQSNTPLYSPPLNLLRRCLVFRRLCQILLNIFSLLHAGKKNLEFLPWDESIFNTDTHLLITWDRLERRGLGHKKAKIRFLGALPCACI